VEKYCKSERAEITYGARAYMPDTYVYKYTIRICNTFFFPTATMFAQTSLNVALCIHCLPCFTNSRILKQKAPDNNEVYLSFLIRGSLARKRFVTPLWHIKLDAAPKFLENVRAPGKNESLMCIIFYPRVTEVSKAVSVKVSASKCLLRFRCVCNILRKLIITFSISVRLAWNNSTHK
jgi:hypothetical protein